MYDLVSLTDFTASLGAPHGQKPRGYVRGDDISAVVYETNDQQIHELAFTGGGWVHNSLSAYGGSGGIRPMGYVRHDNVSAVVYMSNDGHIHELALVGEENAPWKDFDLTGLYGGPGGSALGNLGPMGYRRSDNISAVVYGGKDGHIHELALVGEDSSPWKDFDLTELFGGPGGSSPMGYVRHDNISAVVYGGSDGHIHELALVKEENAPWKDFDLTGLFGGPGGYSPKGYVRHDNVSSVVYAGADRHPHEFALIVTEGVWRDFDLRPEFEGSQGGGLPEPCNRRNGSSSVVYSNELAQMHELILGDNAWWDYNISKEMYAQSIFIGNSPMGYVRSDGQYAMVFERNGAIHEILPSVRIAT